MPLGGTFQGDVEVGSGLHPYSFPGLVDHPLKWREEGATIHWLEFEVHRKPSHATAGRSPVTIMLRLQRFRSSLLMPKRLATMAMC